MGYKNGQQSCWYVPTAEQPLDGSDNFSNQSYSQYLWRTLKNRKYQKENMKNYKIIVTLVHIQFQTFVLPEIDSSIFY